MAAITPILATDMPVSAWVISKRITRIKTSDNPKLVSSKEELEQAVVVSEEADTIQVLDPENMKTVTVARPKELENVGETVDVVRFKGELYIVGH